MPVFDQPACCQLTSPPARIHRACRNSLRNIPCETIRTVAKSLCSKKSTIFDARDRTSSNDSPPGPGKGVALAPTLGSITHRHCDHGWFSKDPILISINHSLVNNGGLGSCSSALYIAIAVSRARESGLEYIIENYIKIIVLSA